MINELIAGISQKLDAEFDEIEIYTDKIKQGLSEPCFFIMVLNSKQDQMVGNRYYRNQSFDIHYFPKTDNTSELNEISDKLMNALEYIEFDGGLLRGTKMHSEIVNGVLHYFVDYNCIMTKQQYDEYMLSLKVNEKVRVNGRK